MRHHTRKNLFLWLNRHGAGIRIRRLEFQIYVYGRPLWRKR